MTTTPTIDFSPQRVDLKFRRGDAVAIPIRFGPVATPVNVSARTFRSQIRVKAADPAIVLAFTIDMTNAATGVVVVRATAAATVALLGKFVWDFEDVTIGRTYFGGQVVIDADVSRA